MMDIDLPAVKRITVKGTKNPIQPTERLACFRTRLHTTAEQYTKLCEWMHAGRWAFNAMVQEVRGGAQPTDAKVNEMCKAARAMPQYKGSVHGCVLRSAMLDVRAAIQTETTKAAKDSTYRKGTINFRSLRRTTTESIRLDAAVFKPNDKLGTGKPNDTGPILFMQRDTTPERQRPSNRIHAEVQFGCGMKALGPVTIRERRWLVEKLANDRFIRHEAKLHWDKRLHALYLIVTLRQERPPDPDPTCARKRVIAMDPGVRHFQTYIDMSTGRNGELLHGFARIDHHNRVLETKSAADELRDRCRRIDRLQTKVNDAARWRAHTREPVGFRGHRWAQALADDRLGQREFAPRRDRQVHQARRQAKRLMQRCYVHLRHLKRDMHYAACGFCGVLATP